MEKIVFYQTLVVIDFISGSATRTNVKKLKYNWGYDYSLNIKRINDNIYITTSTEYPDFRLAFINWCKEKLNYNHINIFVREIVRYQM